MTMETEDQCYLLQRREYFEEGKEWGDWEEEWQVPGDWFDYEEREARGPVWAAKLTVYTRHPVLDQVVGFFFNDVQDARKIAGWLQAKYGPKCEFRVVQGRVIYDEENPNADSPLAPEARFSGPNMEQIKKLADDVMEVHEEEAHED